MHVDQTATALHPGDRVRRRDGAMTGIVRRVVRGNPRAATYMQRIDRVAVDWDDGERSLIAVTRVWKFEALP